MQLLLLIFPLIAMLVVASVADLRTRRIPNWLTVTIALTGLVHSIAWSHSFANWWQAMLGMTVGLAVNLPLFLLRIRGGGDVKLFAGVGAWLGPVSVLAVFITATVVAMLVAVVQAIVTRRLGEVAGNTATMAVGVFHREASTDIHDTAAGYAVRHVPYAVPVLIATVALVGMS